MAHTPSPQERDQAWSLLMSAAQSGDRSAYERLLREVTPFIRALARRHCRNAADIDELVQETLLTVHRVRQTYDPRRAFSPWLAAIATRRSIDALRRRSRIARHEAPEAGVYETFMDAAANSGMEAVRAADEIGEMLKLLPTRQRQALEALKVRQLSLAEAATASGQSPGALKVNAHRALKALRAMFEKGSSE